MKLVRFGPPGDERPGILDASGTVRDASSLVRDWSGSALEASSLSEILRADLSRLPEAPPASRLGSPIAAPGKIVCVGLNYADHAEETGFELPQEPLVFFKSPTALSGPFDPIVIPATAKAVDWEVELAVVMGGVALNVRPEEVASFIAGVAVANDVTERHWQFERGGQWSKAKSADTFAPFGPWLVTLDDLPASLDLRIWLQKNEMPQQESRTGKMVFSVSQIIAHLSEFMTLLPGDLLLTGTPHGVAYNKPKPDYLKESDVITCGIEGLGSQRCAVQAAVSSTHK
ncbi:MULTISPECIES: fumarylacetoacetate hydrolase family protein [Paraburkholderia]|uniref:2-hydroxyhepta-2,4-diene-1,7-dioate isomerase n=1 Tax=Paraburkholderia madseniana TaxID=2599607 RepID=A0A6N6WK78_9BURK|nr:MULTISPECIES: fumarylacetoacetate hydrolase family protein [Paraburkholderia]KAE8759830.1 2-hydroxyhepta-2,4-diene-1,7-dioate isomerase [Paraburkholderia madseniana]MCX4169874.1 fumarylacetoacetate hydrolase family protein [Paraburkholderia madseniana]MDQ6457886.1 fumarylacetoacetate hydrolase family protein [Paraburkholderia madseniana]NPT64754.1 2-hydroxyhepta-2,4-diene-1,7-dioate isomerase [Paraburkholderia madseniana]